MRLSTNGGEKTVNVDKHQYATFTWELYKHSTSLPPFKLEIWIKISRHKIHLTLNNIHSEVIQIENQLESLSKGLQNKNYINTQMPQNCRIVSTRQKSHSVPKDGIWCMISSLAVSMNTIRSSKLKVKLI